MIVPGTGYDCTAVITASTEPCKFNGIVTQNDPTYLGGNRGASSDPLPLQWDPRFGMAWDVFGDSKMAIRASVGVIPRRDRRRLSEGGPAWRFRQTGFYFTDMNSFLTGAVRRLHLTVSAACGRTGRSSPVTYNYTFGHPAGTRLAHGAGRGLRRQSTRITTARAGTSTPLPAGVRFLPSSHDTRPLPEIRCRTLSCVRFSVRRTLTSSGPATKSRYDSLQAQVNRRFISGLRAIAGSSPMPAAPTTAGNRTIRCRPARPATGLRYPEPSLSLSYVVDVPRGSRLVSSQERSGCWTTGSGRESPPLATVNSSDVSVLDEPTPSTSRAAANPATHHRADRRRWLPHGEAEP